MSMASRVRKLELEAEEYLIDIPQMDGTVQRFPEDSVTEAMVSHFERGRAHLDGTPYEDLPPPHPLVEALRGARDLDTLVGTHGTVISFLLGEEEILRGERERPGPAVTWNEEGTVCQ